MIWNRGCHVRGSEQLGCRDFSLGQNITVIECLCDEELCNEKIELTTSTKKPTTTEGKKFYAKIEFISLFYILMKLIWIKY